MANNLRERRRARGYTRPEAAAIIGVHTMTVDAWERGDHGLACERHRVARTIYGPGPLPSTGHPETAPVEHDLAEVLKGWRRRHNLTLKRAADLSALSAPTLCRVEQGKRVSRRTLRQLKGLLDTLP